VSAVVAGPSKEKQLVFTMRRSAVTRVPCRWLERSLCR